MSRRVKSLTSTLVDYFESGNVRDITVPKFHNNEEKWLFESLLNIIKQLRRNGINSTDIHPDNLGLKPDGSLAMFDLGGSYDWMNFNKDLESIVLEENNLLRKIKEILGIKHSKFLGSGAYGYAHDIGNNRVLKITDDVSEAVNSKKLIGKNNKYLSNIYDVRAFRTTSGKIYYVIILEKLKKDSRISKIYDNLEKSMNYQVSPHIEPIVLNYIKDPFVRNFLKYIVKNGYFETWKMYKDKIKDYEDKYDFNDISEISEWIKGSKTNEHITTQEVPLYIKKLIKKLSK